METTISFGKIAFDGNKSKINEVTAEIELKQNDNGEWCFSASACVWNSRHTDCVAGGQCFDELVTYFQHNEEFKKLYLLWKAYHFNDLKAGTPQQYNALKIAEKKGIDVSDYDKQCEYLKSIDMYESKWNGKEIAWGHQWITWAIPEEDLDIIKKSYFADKFAA